MLRLASLLWRLRRATSVETGLFEIQADHLREFRQAREVDPHPREIISAMFRQADQANHDPVQTSQHSDGSLMTVPHSISKAVGSAGIPAAEVARCFLRLANLPNYAFDRLSRYEVTLWRQVGQILLALDTLDRRKPYERRRRSSINRHQPPAHEPNEF